MPWSAFFGGGERCRLPRRARRVRGVLRRQRDRLDRGGEGILTAHDFVECVADELRIKEFGYRRSDLGRFWPFVIFRGIGEDVKWRANLHNAICVRVVLKA